MKILSLEKISDGVSVPIGEEKPIIRVTYKSWGKIKTRDITRKYSSNSSFWLFMDDGSDLPYSLSDTIVAFLESGYNDYDLNDDMKFLDKKK